MYSPNSGGGRGRGRGRNSEAVYRAVGRSLPSTDNSKTPLIRSFEVKMVKLTMIARVTDGLPLVEGLDDGRDVQDADFYKQQVKALFKNLSRVLNHASRLSVETGPYICHYIIEGNVCYLTMCDRSYPKKLAFLYLEDLRSEFERVNGSQIETAARPYAFTKFDTFIQKTKKLYQDTGAQRNIAKLNDELYEVHQIMTCHIQEVLGVGETMDKVSQMSSHLTSESHVYSDKARDLNRSTIPKSEACEERNNTAGRFEVNDFPSTLVPFDICLEKSGMPLKLKAPLLVQNREKRNEIKRSLGGGDIRILRPGMVLLKSYISCGDQVKIVKTCRKIGQGSGGFYQPGYSDGAMLHLKMMCLGKNWNPETSLYGDRRSVDGAKPPPIPSEFHQLVQKAIQYTYAHLQKVNQQKNVESMLPAMSADICIVNFYSSTGRLGLHQDKDESPESLNSGLPVVSFSIGDSAEFLYGDQRDVDKAEKVILESGDILIFGGKSRLVFHGVSSILSKTAPESLLEQSGLRPGRLNLTFRKH